MALAVLLFSFAAINPVEGMPFRGGARKPVVDSLPVDQFNPHMNLIKDSSVAYTKAEKQVVNSLTNGKSVPRVRLDAQTPEVAEVVDFALTVMNAKWKARNPKRVARVINIVSAFKDKHLLSDPYIFFDATLQLRRANGLQEFQDIRVKQSTNPAKPGMKLVKHNLRSSAYSMRSRNFGELVTIKRAEKATRPVPSNIRDDTRL